MAEDLKNLKLPIADKTTAPRIKSSVLGKEYPATSEGARQMREDQNAYWKSQETPKKTQ